MPTRKEIQTQIDEKLSWARSKLHEVKSKVEDAGHETSEEVSHAIRKAEDILQKGEKKAKDFAEASDDDFDVMWAKTKHNWHDIRRDMEGHWDDLSSKVRHLFQ
jgi:ElaB/YqjD/DUF883 family membrane-anchored ribosome-binding protein